MLKPGNAGLPEANLPQESRRLPKDSGSITNATGWQARATGAINMATLTTPHALRKGALTPPAQERDLAQRQKIMPRDSVTDVEFIPPSGPQ